MTTLTFEDLKTLAAEVGLSIVSVACPDELERERRHLEAWQQDGLAAEMEYMNRSVDLLTHPNVTIMRRTIEKGLNPSNIVLPQLRCNNGTCPQSMPPYKPRRIALGYLSEEWEEILDVSISGYDSGIPGQSRAFGPHNGSSLKDRRILFISAHP